MVFKRILDLNSVIFSKPLNKTWHHELFVHMLNDCHLFLLLGFKTVFILSGSCEELLSNIANSSK